MMRDTAYPVCKPVPQNAVRYTSVPSPLGVVWLAGTEKGLCRVGIALSEAEWMQTLLRETGSPAARDDVCLAEARRQLVEYFAGTRRVFDLPLDLAGTSFQRRVWEATGRIPYGHVRTYGELASASGAPRAARAVGGALGSNPVPIVIPCHRVVRSDGALGGYTGGVGIKETLLALERGA